VHPAICHPTVHPPRSRVNPEQRKESGEPKEKNRVNPLFFAPRIQHVGLCGGALGLTLLRKKEG